MEKGLPRKEGAASRGDPTGKAMVSAGVWGGRGTWLCASNMPARRLQGGDSESKHGSRSPHCLWPPPPPGRTGVCEGGVLSPVETPRGRRSLTGTSEHNPEPVLAVPAAPAVSFPGSN